MLGIFYVSYTNSVNLIRKEIQNSLLSLSQQVNNNLEDWLKKTDNLSSMLYSQELFGKILGNSKYKEDSYDMLNDNREFDKFFMYILNQSNEIDSIYIFTQNENVFYKSYSGSMKLGYDVENEAWYKETVKKNGEITFFGIHHPWPLSNSKARVFSMARQIRNLDGQILGVMLIDIKLDSLSKLIKKSISNYNSEFLIVDNNENLVYYYDKYNITDKANGNTINDLVRSNKSTLIDKINGKDTFLTYLSSSFSGWKIISITPEESINRNSSKLLKLNAIIAVISSAVFSLLVILLYLTICKPVYRLSLSMKKVEAGDFSVQVAEQSKDEIGQLCINFNNMIHKINLLIESEYKATILRKDAEFKALQSQINPHFLYNTLQLISSISVVKKVPEINEASKSLGYMLRYSIKTNKDFVPFRDELEHVLSYIAIQKIRMEDKVTVSVDINQSVFNFGIMKLVLQPFVENAFNHGIDRKRDMGIVELSAQLEEQIIVIKVKDNGIGMSPEKLEHLRKSLDGQEKTNTSGEISIGIHNVNSRLKLFYGSEYTLKIESSLASGTAITLKVPAIKQEMG